MRPGSRGKRRIQPLLGSCTSGVCALFPDTSYVTMLDMSQAAPALTRTPAEVVRQTPVSQASNGVCYASSGEVTISEGDLERMVAAVPRSAAAALERKAYYFVPLTVSQGGDPGIAVRC